MCMVLPATWTWQMFADVLTATMQGLALRMIIFPDFFTAARVRSLLRQTLEALIRTSSPRIQSDRKRGTCKQARVDGLFGSADAFRLASRPWLGMGNRTSYQ